MATAPEPMQQLGAFEAGAALQVLPRLEALGIPFELETEAGLLPRTNPALQAYLGLNSAGSKCLIFVPASRLLEAKAASQLWLPREESPSSGP